MVIRTTITFLLTCILSAGCTPFKEGTHAGQKVDHITYRFIDSSVPPQFHRSYSIEVSPSQIRLVVDSYGEVLYDQSFESELATFNAVINSFRIAKLKNKGQNEDSGCSGGTGEKVLLKVEQTILFSGSVYHCQGNWGNLTGDLEQFSTVVKALVPDLGSILKAL